MDSSNVELEAPLVAVDMISDSDEVNPELQGDTVAELGSGITFEVIGIVDPTAQVLDNSDGRENASKNLVTWADGSKWSYITYEKDGQIKLIPEKSDESEAQISLETEEAQSDAVLFDDNQQETSEVEGQVILLEDGQLALFKHHGLASTDMVQIDDNFTTLYTVAEEGENGGTTLIAVEGGRTEEQAVEPKTKKKTKWLPCPAPGCTRSYSSIHHLKVHIRTHTGARPYVCTFEGCPKAFATDYSLKTHIRTHTGEKPFSCPNESCSKAFKTSGDLQKHIRTHTGERPFVCPFQGCNRSFTTSTIRKGHIRTHTGERPFVCSHSGCFRAFASSTNYKNHMRIHSGEKPYACKVPDCHRRFTEYSSLHKHQLVHTQYRHHRCHFCDRAYRQAATLTAHKRVVHGAITTKDGTEIILEQMISGDSNRNFQSLTNDLLNLKREGTFVAVDRNEDTSLFIVSQANDDHELEFGDGEEDNSL